ncbi:MAG TPA: Rieske 2Fe-2S domain-containing protein [Stellaceae bacterium]|nr:Rieske 2Fe-2S domain-containing protein [Stellaceae bacterium]
MPTATTSNRALRWPAEGVARVPFRVFADPDIYAQEQERIFRGPVWNFLCLEIEIPKPGDIRLAAVGETPIIVTRDEAGAVHAMVNRCAHRGALVCLKERDHADALTCPYHSWSYDLTGQLQSVAFRRGVRGKGGMPADFDPAEHRLDPLRVESFCGLVFGTFSPDTPPVETYLGPMTSGLVRRALGRPYRLLGMHSQMLHNNWKLYAENLRDSYHASLLHTFYTAFKINRLDMDGGMLLSEDGRHSVSYSKRASLQSGEEFNGMRAAQYGSDLAGPQLLESFDEWPDGITHAIQAIFPTLGVQFTLNSLAVRFFTPRGLDETELFWMYLGREDDDPARIEMRALQSNLTGAAGLVSLEDGCINEFVQRGTRGSPEAAAFVEMGGRTVGSSENSRATETGVRGFWQAYRALMGL